MIPDFITHYYLPDKKPFLNLSDLSKEEMDPIVKELNRRADEGKIHRGFPNWYFPQRKEAEKNLRKAFIEKGGNPKRKAPHYFTLGKFFDLEWDYKNDFKTVEIPIELVKSKLMFSIGDTILTFAKQHNPNAEKKWINQWFQGKLYDYKETVDIIRKIGLDIDNEESFNELKVFCIETFIWCDDELNELLIQLGYEAYPTKV